MTKSSTDDFVIFYTPTAEQHSLFEVLFSINQSESPLKSISVVLFRMDCTFLYGGAINNITRKNFKNTRGQVQEVSKFEHLIFRRVNVYGCI